MRELGVIGDMRGRAACDGGSMRRVLVVLMIGTASCTTAQQAKTSAGIGAVTFGIGAGVAAASIKTNWEANQTAVGVGAFTAAGGLLVLTTSLLSLIVLRDGP